MQIESAAFNYNQAIQRAIRQLSGSGGQRTIRKQKRLRDDYKAAGLEEDAQAANIKLRRLNAKYKEFSKAAGLPEQRERL